MEYYRQSKTKKLQALREEQVEVSQRKSQNPFLSPPPPFWLFFSPTLTCFFFCKHDTQDFIFVFAHSGSFLLTITNPHLPNTVS